MHNHHGIKTKDINIYEISNLRFQHLSLWGEVLRLPPLRNVSDISDFKRVPELKADSRVSPSLNIATPHDVWCYVPTYKDHKRIQYVAYGSIR
jgi:hypothetical protein